MVAVEKISCKQLILIIFISKVILTLVYLPGITTPPANEDLWLEAILNFPFYMLFILPIFLLWKMYPDQTIIQSSQTILGKMGKVIGLLYVWLFIHETALDLTLFSFFIISCILPRIPLIVITISMIALCIYAIFKGIEVIGRVTEIVTVVFVIMMVTVVLSSLKDMRLEALQPIMGDGLLPLLGNSSILSLRTIEMLGFAMLLPFLKDKKKAKKTIILSFIFIITVFVIIDILVITVLGLEDAKHREFPVYSVVRLIKAGAFFERIEVIHIGVWVLGAFIKITLFYYLSVIGISQVFNMKDYKPVIIPLGTIIIPLSFIASPNIIEIKDFTSYKIFPWYVFIYTIIIPIFLLIISKIRKGLKQNE